MAHVLVIGGGLSGCAIALELADNNLEVTVIEKSGSIGGKVRNYGCKATEQCNNCGLCIVGDLWERVLHHGKIKIITQAQLTDITGVKGNYQTIVRTPQGLEALPKVSFIVVSIGFEAFTSESFGHLEYISNGSIISGSQLEKLLSNRKKNGILAKQPGSIAFIQCFGSRDIQEKALYCSRVCCGYSTRAARVLRQYYPDSKILMFYMDIQKVEEGQYFELLTGENIGFVKCRPIKIKPGEPCRILYEQPETGVIAEKEFDLIVLSEGIHPPQDAEKLAELCTLGINNYGFLKHVTDPARTGIYLAGCASGPKRIEEAYTESVTAARQIISNTVS